MKHKSHHIAGSLVWGFVRVSWRRSRNLRASFLHPILFASSQIAAPPARYSHKTPNKVNLLSLLAGYTISCIPLYLWRQISSEDQLFEPGLSHLIVFLEFTLTCLSPLQINWEFEFTDLELAGSYCIILFSIPLQCEQTIENFHMFHVFLSTLTSTWRRCSLESRKGVLATKMFGHVDGTFYLTKLKNVLN